MGEQFPGGQVSTLLFPAIVVAARPIPGSGGCGFPVCKTLGGWLEWSWKGGHKSHWLKSLKMEDQKELILYAEERVSPEAVFCPQLQTLMANGKAFVTACKGEEINNQRPGTARQEKRAPFQLWQGFVLTSHPQGFENQVPPLLHL